MCKIFVDWHVHCKFKFIGIFSSIASHCMYTVRSYSQLNSAILSAFATTRVTVDKLIVEFLSAVCVIDTLTIHAMLQQQTEEKPE